MEGLVDNLAAGLAAVAGVTPLAMIAVGVAAGIAIGVLPGLSPAIGVALVLPATYGLAPEPALMLLVSVYLAANYGGSITAIAINTPGTPGAVATTFDGYPLTRRGQPRLALETSLSASVFGGLVGAVALVLFAAPLAEVALHLSSYEYFALAVFGLTVIAALAGQDPAKGFMAAALGLLLVTVGYDTQLPLSRFDMGVAELSGGVPFVPALIGLFALGEVFFRVEVAARERASPAPAATVATAGAGEARLTRRRLWGLKGVMMKSSLLGTLIGSVPGAGGTVATFIAYNEAKRASREPETFGGGSLEGIAAPEAANNASVGGALIPLMTLGIPGSASTAVLLGALMIHRLAPGPQLFEAEPGLVYGVFVALFVANAMMLVMGRLGARLWLRVIAAPRALLYPLIVALAVVGCYFVERSLFHVALGLGFGVLGWLLKRADYPTAPVVLGLVLGRMIEENLTLSLVKGGWAGLLDRPVALMLLGLTALAIAIPLIRRTRRGRSRSDSQ
ncbi:MAG: C4-dicarboxylate ABC transporter permease [Proteobacteria bacterium]|nr:MAG: C4-dicarboxylate ABC transporter permease [Pseudomonadota bacterium]